jgi:isochorismate synthase EntC
VPSVKEWLDQSFFSNGAFLSSCDGETVTLGKGGSIAYIKEFGPTKTPLFYLKDFYSDTYLTYRPQMILTCSRKEVMEAIRQIKFKTPSYKTLGNDDDLYQKDFHTLKNIFGKSLEKVVLVSRETYQDFQGPESVRAFFQKAFEIGTGIPYGVWAQDFGMIGSTPEHLYVINGKELKTIALAGTAGHGQEQELLQSQKDRHEHNLVIQDIREKLLNFIQELDVKETKIKSFKNMIHLCTEIHALIKDSVNYTLLTNALSPTAALGGYPKVDAMNFLKSSLYGRRYPQRYFGSSFGILSEEMKQFVVSIRNIQWNKNELFIESGGGVVAESDFQKELGEIHLKRETIRTHYL